MKNYKILSTICLSGLLSACGSDPKDSSATTATQSTALSAFASLESAQAFNTIDYPAFDVQEFVDGDSSNSTTKLLYKISEDTSVSGSNTPSTVEIDKDCKITVNKGANLITGILRINADNVRIDVTDKHSFQAQIIDITWENPNGVLDFTNEYTLVKTNSTPSYSDKGKNAIIKTTGIGTIKAKTLNPDPDDHILVNKGTLTINPDQPVNSSGTIALMDEAAKIEFKQPFKQNYDGSLVILGKSTDTRITAPTTHLSGTLKTLGEVSGKIISSTDNKCQGIFDIVNLPSGAVYYEKDGVTIKTDTFAPIEEWRTKIKLEKKEISKKYDTENFTSYLTDLDKPDHPTEIIDHEQEDTPENRRNIASANRIDLSTTSSSITDISSLEKIGRLRLTSYNSSSITVNTQESLQIQVLDIISHSPSVFNFAHAPKFTKTLAPTVGFEDAESAPTMITNTGNTTWQVGGVKGDITLENGMHFAHKDGKFICRNMTNVSGIIILDGAKANIEVDEFIHGKEGKLVILHDGDFSEPLITASKASIDGSLEVIANKPGWKFSPLIKAKGASWFKDNIGVQSWIEDETPDGTLIKYSPAGTAASFLQKNTNSLLSALFHDAETSEFKVAQSFTITSFATPDAKTNSKILPTCGASLKFKDIDLFASNIVLDDQPQATTVTSLGFGAHHTFDNLTLSCKFTQHTQDFKSMKFGSINADASAQQNILSVGGKLNSGNAYFSFDYHHPVSTSKLHAQFQTFTGSKDMAFDAETSSMIQVKAGVNKEDMNLQAQIIHAENGATKYAFEVTFKQ